MMEQSEGAVAKRPRKLGLLSAGITLGEVAAALTSRVSPEDAEALVGLRGCKSPEDAEAKGWIQALEARHGAGFWKAEMFECTDSEFMARLQSWGREFALSMVGRVWPAAIYQQHRLQVAYIQEYFKARADTTEAELTRLRQLSERGSDPENAEDQVLRDLRQFFDCILQDPQVKIVDLAGGPGCCAAGAWRFFTGSMSCRTVEATVADPVEEWSWCHKLLGLQFRPCASLSDMLLEDCTFTADVVLLGWAMNFASESFFARLRTAFDQRSTFLPGSRSQALVIVMDGRLDHFCFKDKRHKELGKPGVFQKDYGANVCYSWLLGNPRLPGTSAPSGDL